MTLPSPDEMEQKRNHTFYITNRASNLLDELAQEWGVPRNAVLERAIRAVHAARSALTYEIARQEAERELEQEPRPAHLQYRVFAYSDKTTIAVREIVPNVLTADRRVKEILEEHPDWRCVIYPMARNKPETSQQEPGTS